MPLLCKASISRRHVLCQASISRRSVLCKVSISCRSVLSPSSISRMPVLSKASISCRSVFFQASISRRPVLCQASISKAGRQTACYQLLQTTAVLNPTTNAPRPRGIARKLDVTSSTFGRFVPFCYMLSTDTENLRSVRESVRPKYTVHSVVQCKTCLNFLCCFTSTELTTK